MGRQLHRALPRPMDAARRTLVRDVMTREPITVRADTPLQALIELFVARGLGHLPVIDDAGRAIGIVTRTDLIRDAYLRRTATATQSTRDVMTPVVLSVADTASIAEAARILASGELHAVVVTDDAERVVGILSAIDIVAWIAGDIAGAWRA